VSHFRGSVCNTHLERAFCVAQQQVNNNFLLAESIVSMLFLKRVESPWLHVQSEII
jgi:hypothetical protein